MKKITRTSSRQGDVITDTYQKQVSRNFLGRNISKSVNATTETDLKNQKTNAYGIKTRIVSKNGEVLKTKTKKLSPRKVIRSY